MEPSNTFGYLINLTFIDNNTGFIVGDSSLILKTTDTGVTWNKQNQPGSNYNTSINFITPQTGYLISNPGDTSTGYVYKTTNSGNSWFPVYSDTSLLMLRVAFTSINTGYAVGGIYDFSSIAGFIIKTTNAGVTWNRLNVTSVAHFSGISFINDNVGWITSLDGEIFKTNNGGNNWDLQYHTSGWFSKIFFLNSNTGYTTGSYSILKTTNGGIIGITPISSNIPNKFNLFQNYPNPFNPTTKIKFALPKSALAKLVVYDILGREIQTIVNEQLNAGIYEADWDANNYPSGIYYYKIITKDFSETKKMVLVK